MPIRPTPGTKGVKTLKGDRDPKAQQRRVDVAKLRLDGWTLSKIALRFSVSVDTIKSDLKIAETEWRENVTRDLTEHKAREVAKLDRMETQMADQYRQGKIKDAEWVKVRLAILKRRHAILGLDAASRLEVSGLGTGGGPLTISVIDEILQLAGWTQSQPPLSSHPTIVPDHIPAPALKPTPTPPPSPSPQPGPGPSLVLDLDHEKD